MTFRQFTAEGIVDAGFLTLLFLLLLAFLYVLLQFRIQKIVDTKFQREYAEKIQADMREFYREMESYTALFDNRIQKISNLIQNHRELVTRWGEISETLKKTKKGKELSDLITKSLERDAKIIELVELIRKKPSRMDDTRLASTVEQFTAEPIVREIKEEIKQKSVKMSQPASSRSVTKQQESKKAANPQQSSLSDESDLFEEVILSEAQNKQKVTVTQKKPVSHLPLPASTQNKVQQKSAESSGWFMRTVKSLGSGVENVFKTILSSEPPAYRKNADGSYSPLKAKDQNPLANFADDLQTKAKTVSASDSPKINDLAKLQNFKKMFDEHKANNPQFEKIKPLTEPELPKTEKSYRERPEEKFFQDLHSQNEDTRIHALKNLLEREFRPREIAEGSGLPMANIQGMINFIEFQNGVSDRSTDNFLSH